MRRLSIAIVLILSVIWSFFVLVPVYAQPIQEGLSWLTTNQNPDGSWGGELEAIAAVYHSTCVTISAMQYLGVTDGAVSDAIGWLSAQEKETVDELSRQIDALRKDGQDVTEKVNLLFSYKQSDKGWGIDGDGTSDVLDTILAERVLRTAGSLDDNLVQEILEFIFSNQNPDGGFSYSKNMESNTYVTSLVLITLSSYQNTYEIDTNINDALSWLLGQQNADGSFGSFSELGAGTIFETALAYSALIRTAYTSVTTQDALDYIESTQLTNGSWNDNAFETALALRALKDSQLPPPPPADLTLESYDISFEPENPETGDTVSITAVVYNLGGISADNVVVQFFNGDPDNGGIQLGSDLTISSLRAGGNTDITMNIVGFLRGVYDIYAKVDPYNTVLESDDTNNKASNTLTVTEVIGTAADLSISSSDIVFSPDAPTASDPITITATIHNTGGSSASNVKVRFYDGQVQLGPDFNCDYIAAGGGVILQLVSTLTLWDHDIYVKIDPDDQIIEFDEDNNQAFIPITVSPSANPLADLSLSASDISFSNTSPTEADTVTVTAVINNIGGSDASQVIVQCYNGVPEAGEINLKGASILPIVSAGGGQTVDFDLTLPVGAHDVYIIIDPYNTVAEPDETNNQSFKSISVSPVPVTLPDLIVNAADIGFSNTAPFSGDTIAISAVIRNVGVPAENVNVRFYDGDPSAGVQIGLDQFVPLVATGDVVSLSVDWTIPSVGIHDIYVVIDPANTIKELNESNNKAYENIGVSSLFSGNIDVSTDKGEYIVNENVQIEMDVVIDQLDQRFKTWTTKEDWEAEGTTRINIDTETSSGDVLPYLSNIVAYWKFEEESNPIYDETANNNDGTYNGSLYQQTGKVSYGIGFDHSNNDYVSIGGGGGLNNLQTGSISMWVKWNGTQDDSRWNVAGAVLARQKNGVFSEDVIGLSSADPTAGKVIWQPYRVWSSKITGNTTVGDGIWRHIVITFSSGSHILYVDGRQDGASSATGKMSNDSSVPLTIGAWIDHGQSYSTSVIDEVIIWNVVLTADEIADVYEFGCRECLAATWSGIYDAGQTVDWGEISWNATLPSDSALVAYWPMDEGEGAVLTDFSEYNNTGAINGAAWTDGKYGKALSFDGNDDYVVVPDTVLFAMTDATFSAWIKTIQNTQGNIVRQNGPTLVGPRSLWGFLVRAGGYAGFVVDWTGYGVKSSVTINDGSWHHIAAVRDAGETLKVYVDGVLNNQVSDSISGIINSSQDLFIGKAIDNTEYFNGVIDEIKIYNRALSAEEVAILWNIPPSQTMIKLRTRTANTKESLSAAVWSDYYIDPDSAITSPNNRWLEVEATLKTVNPTITPILHSLCVGYTIDDIAAQVSIKDSQSEILHQFEPIEIADFVLGEPKHYDFIWNTRTIFAGDYQVYGSLTKGGEVTAEDTDTFIILPELGIDSLVATDKIVYTANETVTILSKVTSQSSNFNYTDLVVQESIIGVSGEIFTGEQTIGNLLPGTSQDLKFYWDTGSTAPGDYVVIQKVIFKNTIVSQIEANFKISSSMETAVSFSGQLTVNPQEINAGEEVSFNCQATNIGNVDMENLTLKLLLIDPDTEQVVKNYSDTVTSLLIQGSYTKIFTDTISLPMKKYLVVFQAEVSGVTIPIANSWLYVKFIPATIVIKPESFNKNTGIFTAFVSFPEEYDVSTITDAVCDGAPSESMTYNQGTNQMIIKFSRDQITELPLDITFEVTGHFGENMAFQGTDTILNVLK